MSSGRRALLDAMSMIYFLLLVKFLQDGPAARGARRGRPTYSVERLAFCELPCVMRLED